MSDLDRQILDFLALGDGEGCALGGDIAVEVGVKANAIGSRMVSLVKRGYVNGHRVEGYRHLTGWKLSDEAESGLLEWRPR